MNKILKALQLQEELQEFLEIAVSDISACNALAGEPHIDFWRRTQVRTVFATIEAVCSHLKKSAVMLDLYEDFSLFSEIERQALNDVSYRVADNGDVQSCNARIGLKQNIRLALRCYAKAAGNPDDPLNNNIEWKALERAIKVRDRLTRPKNANSYKITEEDISDLLQGWKWFWEYAIRYSKNSG